MTEIEVLLPIKSPAPWLEETLESLKGQTFTDWRLVAAIHGTDPRVNQLVTHCFPDAVIVNGKSEGDVASTLNAGLKMTTAPYIARIDADDLAVQERLEKQYNYLENHPTVLAVGTGASLIGPNGENLGYRSQIEEPPKILKRLRWKSPLVHPSVMYRREAVLSLGGYSEFAANVEDYDLWLRLGALGPLGGIDLPLIKYRIHPNQITSFRAIPRSALSEVRRSRVALAKVEQRSLIAARYRHLMWVARQEIRRIQRRGRV